MYSVNTYLDCVPIYTIFSPSGANITLWTSTRLDDTGDVLSRIQGIGVKLAGIKRRPLISRLVATRSVKDVANARKGSGLVGSDGVVGALKVDVLDAGIGASASVMTVRGHTREVVIVEMGVEEIVG